MARDGEVAQRFDWRSRWRGAHRAIRTLTRRARPSAQPAFAAEAALAALHWMSEGHGYELTGLDVREACRYAIEAAQSVGQTDQIEQRVQHILAGAGPATRWMREALGGSNR
jgi:hypothetical protein